MFYQSTVDPMAVPHETDLLIPGLEEADLEGGLPHASPSLEQQQSITALYNRLARRISDARDPVATEICGTGSFSHACARIPSHAHTRAHTHAHTCARAQRQEFHARQDPREDAERMQGAKPSGKAAGLQNTLEIRSQTCCRTTSTLPPEEIG